MSVLVLPKFEGRHHTKWVNRHQFKPRMSAAYTFGYGIVVEKSRSADPALIAHELVHVKQMEELGLENYFRRYMVELEVDGNAESPLEIEAIDTGKNFQR